MLCRAREVSPGPLSAVEPAAGRRRAGNMGLLNLAPEAPSARVQFLDARRPCGAAGGQAGEWESLAGEGGVCHTRLPQHMVPVIEPLSPLSPHPRPQAAPSSRAIRDCMEILQRQLHPGDRASVLAGS